MKIITLSGEVQLTKRYWWQLCKKGWYKHSDVWGRLWWIRFNWDGREYTNILKT